MWKRAKESIFRRVLRAEKVLSKVFSLENFLEKTAEIRFRPEQPLSRVPFANAFNVEKSLKPCRTDGRLGGYKYHPHHPEYVTTSPLQNKSLISPRLSM